MPWCTECQKPIQKSGLCPPCERNLVEPEAGFPFLDEDEITQVMGFPPASQGAVLLSAPDYSCGACNGTGDLCGPHDILGCPECLGTGRVQ